jgi:hypothetical protein
VSARQQRRKASPSPLRRVRIRFVPAPRGHDFMPALETLAAIGRRFAPSPSPVAPSPLVEQHDDLPCT